MRIQLTAMSRFTLHTEQCPCGNGTLECYEYEKDNPWSSSSTYHGSVDCEACEIIYTIDVSGGKFKLLRRLEIKAAENFRHEIYEQEQAVMQLPAVQQLKADLVALMDSQRSKAAKYRIVHSLTYESEATFVRKFHGSAAWVDSWVRFDKLPDVLKILKQSNPTLVKAIEAIQGQATLAPKVEIVKTLYALPKD